MLKETLNALFQNIFLTWVLENRSIDFLLHLIQMLIIEFSMLCRHYVGLKKKKKIDFLQAF